MRWAASLSYTDWSEAWVIISPVAKNHTTTCSNVSYTALYMFQRVLKMNTNPDVTAFATRRLLRLLYIEQLSKARVSSFIPPGDTTEVPIVILVGYEAVGKGLYHKQPFV